MSDGAKYYGEKQSREEDGSARDSLTERVTFELRSGGGFLGEEHV